MRKRKNRKEIPQPKLVFNAWGNGKIPRSGDEDEDRDRDWVGKGKGKVVEGMV